MRLESGSKDEVQESVLSSQLYGNTSRACMKQIRAAEVRNMR